MFWIEFRVTDATFPEVIFLNTPRGPLFIIIENYLPKISFSYTLNYFVEISIRSEYRFIARYERWHIYLKGKETPQCVYSEFK